MVRWSEGRKGNEVAEGDDDDENGNDENEDETEVETDNVTRS